MIRVDPTRSTGHSKFATHYRLTRQGHTRGAGEKCDSEPPFHGRNVHCVINSLSFPGPISTKRHTQTQHELSIDVKVVAWC